MKGEKGRGSTTSIPRCEDPKGFRKSHGEKGEKFERSRTKRKKQDQPSHAKFRRKSDRIDLLRRKSSGGMILGLMEGGI